MAIVDDIRLPPDPLLGGSKKSSSSVSPAELMKMIHDWAYSRSQDQHLERFNQIADLIKLQDPDRQKVLDNIGNFTSKSIALRYEYLFHFLNYYKAW